MDILIILQRLYTVGRALRHVDCYQLEFLRSLETANNLSILQKSQSGIMCVTQDRDLHSIPRFSWYV